jgi:hypothetical protein
MRCALRGRSFRCSWTAMQAHWTPFRDAGAARDAGCVFFPAAVHGRRCSRPQHDLRSRYRYPNLGGAAWRHDPETVKLNSIYHSLIRHWAEV